MGKHFDPILFTVRVQHGLQVPAVQWCILPGFHSRRHNENDQVAIRNDWASNQILHIEGIQSRACHSPRTSRRKHQTQIGAGDWGSKTFIKYIDEDTFDAAESMNITLGNPCNERED